MKRPDQIRIDRFPVANAEFWLSMAARWLSEPGSAERFSTDLWGDRSRAESVQVIFFEAAVRLRAVLDDPDATIS